MLTYSLQAPPSDPHFIAAIFAGLVIYPHRDKVWMIAIGAKRISFYG